MSSSIETLATVESTNYPIMLSIEDSTDGFELIVQSDRRISARRMAGYTAEALHSLVQALEGAPDISASELGVVPLAERQEIVERFNPTRRAYPDRALVHQLFEECVSQNPDDVAVSHEQQSLTYRELNARANRLARLLRQTRITADQVVAICVERSVDMVVALLGTLKSGAAYLPLDPNYPKERLKYMLEDAAPHVVLTTKSLQSTLPATASSLVLLDCAEVQLRSYESSNLPVEDAGATAESLVYVIYTSGSTGRPKGTAMRHRSMVNLIDWHRATFADCKRKRVLQFAALSFDVAFQEVFSTLCTGGALVLLNEWVRRDPRALCAFLSHERIERLFLPPLMLQSVAEACESTKSLQLSLRDVITAGEQLRISPEICSFFKRFDRCELHNHYGPTETHVVTALSLTGSPDEWPTLPAIGRPISNIQMYVLDRHRHLAPLGVIGEIYIGGAGVARDYLRRPELTAQRFVEDTFSPDPGARLYKTGDLGRWQANGVLEYLGRNDDQVKIRGYRIELGEIEALLAQHEGIKEVAVVAVGGSEGKRLVAYVTPLNQPAPTAEQLRSLVKSALPDYMVPSAYVVLAELPRTPSGKLDRRALPEPEAEAYATSRYEAPIGESEEILAGIWQTLLHVERVGRSDSFFELGGHSLLATRVVSRARELFNVDLPLKALFDSPTIAGLAGRIELERVEKQSKEAHWLGNRSSDLRTEINQLNDDAVMARLAELETRLAAGIDN